MAFLFRKIGSNIAPMFRKLGAPVAGLGRTISTIGNGIDRGLDRVGAGLGKVEKVVGVIDKYAPNPITKVIKGGLGIGKGVIGGVSDIAGGVGKGGSALSKTVTGDFKGAGRDIVGGVGMGVKGGLQVAPFLV